MSETYDLIIIGGGPAGAAAAVYAGRKRMKTAIIVESWGGQSLVSDKIENWIGTQVISGLELAKMLESHVRAQEGVDVKFPEKAVAVKLESNEFIVTTDKGLHKGRTLIITTGARRRHLQVPGEDKFAGKGVSYCSTCDAPLFKNKTVAVVGGGNAGLEAVVDLFPYASKIYLIVRGIELTGDPLLQEQIRARGNLVTVIKNTQVTEILGDKFVSGLKYVDAGLNQVGELLVDGTFVEIGSQPNSEIVKDLVEINKAGEIIVDHKTSATSQPGIFAAGDITDEIYKQNNISAGDGVVAAISAYNHLLNIKKKSPAEERE